MSANRSAPRNTGEPEIRTVERRDTGAGPNRYVTAAPMLPISIARASATMPAGSRTPMSVQPLSITDRPGGHEFRDVAERDR